MSSRSRARAGKGLDELTEDLEEYPQRLVNIRVREKKGLMELPAVKQEIQRVEAAIRGLGPCPGAILRYRTAGASDGGGGRTLSA